MDVDLLHSVLILALAILAVSLLILTSSHRQLEARVFALETDDGARRAHNRLDAQQHDLDALARELGWSSDRAHVKVIPSLPTH